MLFISCFASFILFTSRSLAIEIIHSNRESFLTNGEISAEDSAFKFDNDQNFQDDCSSSNSRSLLLISTVDGHISCLDSSTGEQLWHHYSDSSLLSSSISYLKTIRDLSNVKFIPSLDGSLYKWNGQNLELVPLSADYLLGKMSQLPDGSLIVGGKDIKISGIDIDTGKLCYECSSMGCQRVALDDNINKKNILIVRRIQHTVRAITKRTAHEKWNFSVGHYDMEFIERDLNEVMAPSSSSFCGQKPIVSNKIHFSLQDGIVSEKESGWTFHYDSPISAAWRFENNEINPIDILKNGVLDGMSDDLPSSLMYLGLYDGQMYIQQPLPSPIVSTFSDEIQVVEQPQITWRPFVATSHARTPFLNNDKRSALATLDYPFDNGFVLASNFSSTELIKPNRRNEDQKENLSKVNENFNGGDQSSRYEPSTQETPNYFDNFAPLSLRDWWKEIVILSIVIAVGIHAAIRVFKYKFRIAEKLKEIYTTPKVEDAAEVNVEVGKEETPAPVIMKKRSNKSSISIALDPIEADNRTLSTSSEFTSSYLTDFEHLQCLGKGGFGVVFKAKKKIDDCEYAIKRIYLPRCEEAKGKMMREVKALAALDHPGIVRYFHAWWEAPPEGWQHATDKEHFITEPSEMGSYMLSHDWVLEVNSCEKEEKTEYNDNCTNGLSLPVNRRSRCDSADPFGKRYNFCTGTEDDIVIDHKDFDLFKHNDVFCNDSSQEEYLKNNEDSFEISFRYNSDQENEENTNSVNSSRDIKSNDVCCLNMVNDRKNNDKVELSSSNHKIFQNSIESEIKSSRTASKSRKRRRYVGKCCTKRSSECLSQPPLYLYIQMQLCQQASLKDWLSEKTCCISLKESMSIFYQIVDAVEYFHSCGMMHRDLKPANIFFSMDGSVKVGDFGLVTAITRPSKGKQKGRVLDAENHTGQVGTQLYMSPEQATGQPYNHKVDIYALGLIYFELLCFFSTQMERVQTLYRMKQGMLPPKLDKTPQGVLAQVLTSHDPISRPEAKEIKNLEYVKKISAIISEVAE